MTLRTQPPAESDLLCEFCGYILNGLQASQGNCPECGKPTADSVEPGHRVDSPIEIEWSSRSFWSTTGRILLKKRRFFRETRTRADHPNVAKFGRLHRWLSGVLFGLAGGFHAWWMIDNFPPISLGPGVAIWIDVNVVILAILTIVLAGLSVLTLTLVTRLAIWLTTKEGAFWGMRLPREVVTRAMSFHAANYLPVAACALLLTAGYRVALAMNWTDARSGVIYLISLCVLVVASALWLFESYVIAMRRIRLANF